MVDKTAILVGRAFRNEIQDATDLAATVGNRRRTLDDFHIVGGADRCREVPGVLDPSEAAEEIVGQVAADLQFAGYAEIIAGEGAGRDVHKVVDVADAIEADDRRLDQGDRSRRLLQGERQVEDAIGLAIGQHIVEVVALGRDGDLADRGRIARLRRRRLLCAGQQGRAERRSRNLRQQGASAGSRPRARGEPRCK